MYNSAKTNFKVLILILLVAAVVLSMSYFIFFETEAKYITGTLAVVALVAVFICMAFYRISPNLFKDKKSVANR